LLLEICDIGIRVVFELFIYDVHISFILFMLTIMSLFLAHETLHFAAFSRALNKFLIYKSKEKHCMSNIRHSYAALSYFLFYQ